MPSAPQIPDSAPFTPEQRAWLNGMIAAISPHYASSPINVQAPEPAAPSLPIKILFGSQTGNSEALAKKSAKAAQKSNLSPTVIDMGSYDPSSLKDESHLMIITSTYGDGEPPDNAKAFYDYLHSEKAPNLENLTYSVLGLGDTSYPDFNQCAINIDQRLASLGALRMTASIFCDVDFDVEAATWQAECFKFLTN